MYTLVEADKVLVRVTKECTRWRYVESDRPGAHEGLNPPTLTMPIDCVGYPRHELCLDALNLDGGSFCSNAAR
ncbi:hypothetical protein THICB1_110366 [Thiomonas arsenitoxydans]|uniref:Uncharacterized protein n=1 Tax=Thiomonas arsenitoxydans (strain DSM 22701 / CIP 110005 / 3As) TaxID=426114 RepID=A0ABP1Z360_THIA3|nr:hypothetical protein THICB1_110366 [Thiomonas arsenitoxydans]CQR30690.1 hypothetical protein THICB6_150430 [Thiomonas arsenitoxydans]CQR31715.1 hypothetical protein ACO3_30004 [Thiomonas arsenitoxydans]CQR31919.1 hypothetical protein ACO7_30004 [Thiomonas arsenitoxydans]